MCWAREKVPQQQDKSEAPSCCVETAANSAPLRSYNMPRGWRREPVIVQSQSSCNNQGPPVESAPNTSPEDAGEAPTCRLCWGGADEGVLVSPCSCSGSVKYIHLRCLQDWQQVLREQGQTRRAQFCEICRHPWRLDRLAAAEAAALSNGEGVHSSSGPRGPGARVHRLVALARAQARFLGLRVLDSLNAPSVPALIFRVWRIWVLGASVCKSLQLGARGMVEGMKLGRALVGEHGSAIARALTLMASLVGTPAAQVLWVQAAAAVLFLLVSEFIYATTLGALLGAGAGFVLGYCNTMRTHGAILVGSTIRLASLVSRTLLKMGRVARTSWALFKRFGARGNVLMLL